MNTAKEIPVNELFMKVRDFNYYVKARWKFICFFIIIGAFLGLCLSLFVKPKYTAVCTFVLDEGGNSGGMLSQYAGLASLAGLDIGGGGGMFKGDNILELYRSRLMLKKTLLTRVDINGRKELLMDRYISFNNLRERWKDHDDIRSISFDSDPAAFNRKQDSLISDITETFNKKNLNVSKPDKKLSIINVSFTAKDELFAKTFTDKLVDNVNDFYIQTKTKKTLQNVNILQRQADSVKSALNSSISGVASAVDAAPNANPALQTLRVPSQRKQVDVQANTAIYSEVKKNLEISKIALRQETPLIQFIDQPVLPLTKSHIGKLTGLCIGAFLGLLLSISLIVAMLFKAKYLDSPKMVSEQ